MVTRIFFFIVGFCFMVLGFSLYIIYFNLFTFGYSIIGYFNYMFTKIEGYYFFIGVIIVLMTIFIRRVNNDVCL